MNMEVNKVCERSTKIHALFGLSEQMTKRFIREMREHPKFEKYIKPINGNCTLVDVQGFSKYTDYLADIKKGRSK